MADILLISWAVVTVIAFVDLLIPDPLPFIDEIALFITSMALLVALAIRGIGGVLSTAWQWISHPLVMTFLITIFFLFIVDKVRKKNKKKVKK